MESEAERPDEVEVTSSDSLIRFIEGLFADFKANEIEWANASVPHYLDSIAAFVGTPQARAAVENSGSTWGALSWILESGKYYE